MIGELADRLADWLERELEAETTVDLAKALLLRGVLFAGACLLLSWIVPYAYISTVLGLHLCIRLVQSFLGLPLSPYPDPPAWLAAFYILSMFLAALLTSCRVRAWLVGDAYVDLATLEATTIAIIKKHTNGTCRRRGGRWWFVGDNGALTQRDLHAIFRRERAEQERLLNVATREAEIAQRKLAAAEQEAAAARREAEARAVELAARAAKTPPPRPVKRAPDPQRDRELALLRRQAEAHERTARALETERAAIKQALRNDAREIGDLKARALQAERVLQDYEAREAARRENRRARKQRRKAQARDQGDMQNRSARREQHA